jgi:hypothetical protein
MTLRFASFSIIALSTVAAAPALAGPTVTSMVFATGGAVFPGGSFIPTAPDSITHGDGSVWVEYGNGADSTGANGDFSTIVRYGFNGKVQDTYNIPGSVDGLKVNPSTGTVWALQNQDGNSTLSFINPTTNAVTGPLLYAAPPYSYSSTGGNGRGYDDVAFLGGKVYLSYTNPMNPGDPVLQVLNNGNVPSGTQTTTSILTAQQVNPDFTSSQDPLQPDIDSLKSTPNGELALTSEGDLLNAGDPAPPAYSAGVLSLIAHPDSPQQTVTNYLVDNAGINVNALDDIIFPGATSGWLYVAGTNSNEVYKLWLTGLDPNAPIAAIGSLDEVAVLGLTGPSGSNPFGTADVTTVLLSDVGGVHGMDFVAAPEPSTWAMLFIGFAGLGFAGCRKAISARGTIAAG